MLVKKYVSGLTVSATRRDAGRPVEASYSLSQDDLDAQPLNRRMDEYALQDFLHKAGLQDLFVCMGDDVGDAQSYFSVQEMELSTGHFVTAGECLADYMGSEQDMHKLTVSALPIWLKSMFRPKRGNTKGWTAAVSRNNFKFLMSIDVEGLKGLYEAFAVTLTVPAGEEVPTPATWQKMRKRLIEGGLRYHKWHLVHWVTEFTRKLTPHLHMTVWVDKDLSLREFHTDLVDRWTDITAKHGYEVSHKSQYAKRVEDTGWFLYQAKHGSRGQTHYQRREVPESWRTSTGRMWGYNGKWEGYLLEPERIETAGNEDLWVMRRHIKKWNLSRARLIVVKDAKSKRRKARAINFGRRGLKCGNEAFSAVRPMKMWADREKVLQILKATNYTLQEMRPPTERQARITQLRRQYGFID
ncbi:hypothetical protein [Rothia sp. ZJ932]|uniref:hypothetical protein n=1 Tax=Rothia sp. ZJ932 TaxID=2810516 RepID=UPI0019676F79|nr:hypothetical protein [Rothia sp. ZJ932]QRZ62674.1 hypothetical protein JR346_10320 [Rothia sp. ZJ932]